MRWNEMLIGLQLKVCCTWIHIYVKNLLRIFLLNVVSETRSNGNYRHSCRLLQKSYWITDRNCSLHDKMIKTASNQHEIHPILRTTCNFYLWKKTLSDIFDNCEEYDFHYEMSQ